MDEALLLDTLLNATNEAIVIVNKDGIITELSKAYTEFLGIKKEDAVGRHVTDVIENTRMHIVLKTGKPEIADAQHIKNQTMIATRIPIYKDGNIVGAFGRVLFKNTKELYSLHDRIMEMESQLSLYRSKYGRINEAKYNVFDIIGESHEISNLRETIQKVAVRNSNILITGESGTGKELVAHAIHNASKRRTGPMICVNCAAIPSELLESELFGYEEGAFTGAKKGGKPGLLKAANNGTLLLDEIGDLSMSMQVKLLRAIQDKEIRKVGSSVGEVINIRFISATNKDLNKMVQENSFRADLFYRLNVISIHIPPIRDRKEDIPALVEHFMQKISVREGVSLRGISAAALQHFKTYDWPGNIRELENAMERASNFVDEDGIIKIKHLQNKVLGTDFGCEKMNLKDILEDTERTTILRAISKHNGVKTNVANELGISRTSLYEKMVKYNISLDTKDF
ncbi:MAG: sigma 54-interacting transcriptional regulator [Candidatus Fimivivens sp.]|nr:sigma 54-interacting transcriptional regulator [Candidatus Fimivivens sp.]